MAAANHRDRRWNARPSPVWRVPVRHSPGSVIDIAVHIERRDASHTSPVRLIGVGLPEAVENQTAVVPGGEQRGYLSLYLPPYLPVARIPLLSARR